MLQRLISNIKIEGEDYFSFPIDAAIEFSPKISTGFYVPLGPSKRVRIEHEGNVEHKLTAYKEKGLKNILFARSDYDSLMKRVKTGVSIFFFNDLLKTKSFNEEQILDYMKASMDKLGMQEQLSQLCAPLITQNINWIKSSSHLSPLYRNMMKNCQEQFIFQVFRSYISVALAQALKWPPHLAEKFIQINLLSDLTLKRKDFESYYMYPDDPEEWTQEFKEHPKEMVKLLERHHSAQIGREVLKGIDQHEEHPSGTGFPYGMAAAAFDQMVAIIVTSRLFTNQLLKKEFSYQDRKSFMDDFAATELNSSHLKNTIKALYTILNLGDNEDVLNL